MKRLLAIPDQPPPCCRQFHRLVVPGMRQLQSLRMTASKMIWHGTPSAALASELEPRVSFLHAIWLSGSPEIAALYAGPGGTVHGFVLAADARLLSAFGHDPDLPWSYPSASEWKEARDFLIDDGIDIEALDCLDDFKIEHGFQPPLGPDGQPSWEGLFGDLCEVTSTGEDLLRRFGFDGIMHTERCELALGDRSAALRGCTDPAYVALAGRLRADVKRPFASVGLLDSSKLVHALTLPGEQVVRMQVPRGLLPTTSAEGLLGWGRRPSLVEFPALLTPQP